MTLRTTLFAATGDLVPYYALYALLFAEHGLGAGQISLLLALWSASAFLCEIPSGAWADTISRRALLMLNGVLLASGFLLWTALPSFAGFALGFVLWGVAGALRSGTFEALLYDELTVRDESRSYARVIGYTRSAAELSAALAILAASPLYLWGGYALVGWVSVGCAVLHTVLAWSLPPAPKVVSATEIAELEDADPGEAEAVGENGCAITGSVPEAKVASACAPKPHPVPVETPGGGIGPVRRYVRMLRTGLTEAVRVRSVRRGVLLGALLYGITAFDEYFALLADEAGAATSVVPVLVGVTVVGSLLGALLAGRTEAMSARIMAGMLCAAAVLFGSGALLAGAATGRPEVAYVLIGPGFGALAVAYGLVHNATIVAEARLQDAITGPARATVTSVMGLLEELVSLAVFGFVAVVTLWMPISPTLALLGLAIATIAVCAPFWLPTRPDDAHGAAQLIRVPE